ncbi:Callose synthase 7 [Abeliophyllum distichum]|uniref:Callose synthase 7 n=1 Tax=Abeliophyllum distichum TaxID=126358 RepID=A0ABD1P3B7_9LAMI
MGNRGGIGISLDKSWESWWNAEQEHLKYTNIRGRVLEIILAFRFFIYQYGIVYQLKIAHQSKSIVVYGLSWFVMVVALLVLKVRCRGQRNQHKKRDRARVKEKLRPSGPPNNQPRMTIPNLRRRTLG